MSAAAPRVVDLFAGAGLLSYAFREEGCQITQAVEMDRCAAQSCAVNLGEVVCPVDVRHTAPVNSCGFVVAGPPCQGFSTLGKRNPSDRRNGLSLELIRWVDAATPAAVVVENVAPFLDSAACSTLTQQLRARFTVHSEVLSTVDFGVHQRRRRAFLVAARSARAFMPGQVDSGCRNPREAWRHLPVRPDGHNLHIAPVPSPLALSQMRLLPPGGDKRDILRQAPELAPPSWITCSDAVTDVWGRIRWEGPANTLRTCFQNPSKGRYIHPEQNRVITIREGARLQTIPDDWQFVGSRTRVAAQIGNGVPPLLGRAVARTVRDLL
ncbi:MAG: DNA cytosine methyltransferase [Bacteroidota bacterium]|nr:DNA cytosine methyltransferase [Bacteroidota bacterium]